MITMEYTMKLIDLFEELIKNKTVEVSDGVNIKCGDEINLVISSEDGNPVIKFGSPAVQVFITKMGPMRLLNAVRPTIQSITITDKSFKISVDNAPDMEVARELV
jgi:hypothetical protein